MVSLLHLHSGAVGACLQVVEQLTCIIEQNARIEGVQAVLTACKTDLSLLTQLIVSLVC